MLYTQSNKLFRKRIQYFIRHYTYYIYHNNSVR